MNSLVAALAAIPRIASALETLALGIGEINKRAVKAKAASRRESKDNAVDKALADLVDTRSCGVLGEASGQCRPANDASTISGSSESGS